MWVLRAVTAIIATAVLAFAQARGLRIEILEGQGAINNVSRRTAWEPVVQVVDENGSPVSGAVVTFTLPSLGASGTFVDGSRVLSIQTDETGRAVARGLRPNGVTGQFEIRVNATHEGAKANATITQTNAAPAQAASKKSKKVLILGLVGAGVAGGVAAALAGGKSNSGTPSQPSDQPTGSVTPGAPGFGPPR